MFKVLIAVDGSEPSKRAIGAVARLAREAARLDVILLNVTSAVSLSASLIAADVDQEEWTRRSHQTRVLEQATVLARRDGLQVNQVEASSGMVAQEIVRMAQAAGADQIVMGAHGLKSNGHYVLGSVAQKVLQLATVPVMLVR